MLRLRGYSDDKIDAAFGKEKGIPKKAIKTPSKETTQVHRKLPYNWIILTIIVLAVAVFIIFITARIQPGKCTTYDCFVAAANECKEASFVNDVAGSLIYADAKDCVLTIRMDKLAADEPQEVKDLFEGTKMDCPYTKGSFNRDLQGDLFGDWIVECNGTLRDAVDELRTAMLVAEIGNTTG